MRVLRQLRAADSLPGEGVRVERADAIERMSATPQQLDQKLPPQPKAPERGKVPQGSKVHEIENLKRLLADVSKRLDKLK